MRSFETDQVSDYARPPTIWEIIATIVLKLFG